MSKQRLINRSIFNALLALSTLPIHAADPLIGDPHAEVRGDFRVEDEGANASEDYGMTTRFVDESGTSPATIDMFSPRTENVWTWWSSFVDGNPPNGNYQMRLDETGSLFLYDVNAGNNVSVIEFDTANKEIRVDGKRLISTSGASVDGVSFSGILDMADAGANIPASGAGVRMMWYPELGAFRSGQANADEWDAPNIGAFSSAFGIGVEASGALSFAVGSQSRATDIGAIAMGWGNEATANNSTAIGGANNLSESSSSVVVGGFNNRALGDYGYGVVLGGSDNYILDGSSNVIIGGGRNILLGSGSVVLGEANYVESEDSGTVGQNLDNYAYASFVVGAFNVDHSVTASIDTWIETDPLFEIGNGNSDLDSSNALTTLKNGQTTLTNKFWVADDETNPNASNGNALVVDGNTVLNGNVTMKRQGDIFMGQFGNIEDQGL